MKIRMKGNTIRYRLAKSEVATLRADGSLEERVEFIGKTLRYVIERTNDDKLAADFIDDKIVLLMPKHMIDALSDTDEVGFSGVSGSVSLLVEKDFACLDNVQEDQSDNYPNPRVNC